MQGVQKVIIRNNYPYYISSNSIDHIRQPTGSLRRVTDKKHTRRRRKME